MRRSWSHAFLALTLVLPLFAGTVRAEEKSSGAQIAPKLQPFVDGHTLAGAVVLVANSDGPLCVETVGYSNVERKTPMKADSFFWIASMSKPITAAALMVLVDDGKVKIDDPVEKYLPEFKDVWVAAEKDRDHIVLKRPKTPITVKHALSHTSGMPFGSSVEFPTRDVLPLALSVRSYTITPLNAEPGTKYDYSNAGINTAGRIVEVVSGMPFEEFLQKRLLDPLGMKDTTFLPNEEQLSRLATVYKPNAAKDGLEPTTISQLKYPLSDPRRNPVPGGGLFSTASDVSNFCRMVLAGGQFEGKRILSEESVKTMTSTQTGDLPTSYGLGWSTPKTPGGTFGHGGALSTNMTIDPQRKLIYIYLVQHAGYPGTEGGKILPTFHKSAQEAFGKPST